MSNTSTQSSRWVWLCGIILAAITIGVYATAYKGDYFLDDYEIVVNNDSLHKLSDVRGWFFEFHNVTRPLTAFSFALDYALWGADPHPYHILNILIHAGAALLLFGVVRRSLLSTRLGGRYDGTATGLAFAAALLWALHPLQTESVAYIVQRHESLMGLFFLLGMYALIRGADSRHRMAWHGLAIAAAILGAGCKQVIAVLPLMALLYDRCFISGSFGAALKRAPFVYLGMMLSWVVIVALMLQVKIAGTVGFSYERVTALDYAKSQLVVVAYYLQLIALPLQQCVYYAWKVEHDPARIIPAAALLAILLGLTLWQLWKNTLTGFWAAWFFIILAPTSTIMPIQDLAFEHRLYLSLASAAILLTLALYRLSNARVTVGVVCALTAAYSVLTVERNLQFHDQAGLLHDTLVNTPHDPVTLAAIGMDRFKAGDVARATEYSQLALKGDPHNLQAHVNLAAIYASAHQDKLAEDEFAAAVAINPRDEQSWRGMFEALRAQGKNPAADARVLRAQDASDAVGASLQFMLGELALQQNRMDDAIQRFSNAFQRAPERVEFGNQLGFLLAKAGRFDEALAAFNAVLAKQANFAPALYNRAMLYEARGELKAAAADYQGAVSQYPDNPNYLTSLAWLWATAPDESLRKGKAAVKFATKACKLTQRSQAVPLDTLAAALAETGQFEEAVKVAEEALAHAGNDAGLAQEIRGHVLLFQGKKAVRTGAAGR